MRRSLMMHRGLRLALVAALLLPAATQAYAAPNDGPAVIVSEGFEVGSTPTYVATPFDSTPYAGSVAGYWGVRPFRAHSGSQGLWVNGSRANGTQYQVDSAGDATFALTQTADYYDSDLSFWLTLPSRGSADLDALSVRIESGTAMPRRYGNFPLTGAGQWSPFSLPLGSDPTVPFARQAGLVKFQWRDGSLDPSENPAVGEGPTIDDVLVSGWKYGPVRSLAGVVSTTSVGLSWLAPYRAVNSTVVEERPISYRVWSAPGGSSDWAELTGARLGSLSYSRPLPAEGVQYRYSVQAWDQGTGTGYGRSSEVTVTIPLTPPTVSMSGPANNFPLTAGIPVNITGSAADAGVGVSKVQVRIRRADGYCWSGLAWVAADTWVDASTSNGWSSWNYSWTPDDALITSGQIVTVNARSRDNAGAYSSLAQATSSAPVAGSVSLADGAPATTQQVVSAAISSQGATHARYSVNGGAYTAWAPFSATTPVNLGSGDGTKTVTFQFSTDGGASISSIASDSILLHSSVPSVAITSPASGYSLLGGAVSIAGTASDVGGTVSSVNIRIRRGDGKCWDGSSWTTADTWRPVSTSNGFATWNTSWTPDAETQDLGQIVTVSARAVDAYGLEQTTAGVSSSVPVVASLSLAGGASYTTTLAVPASVAASGSPNTMRYCIDSGSWTATQTYAPETVVTLPSGDVTRAVTFQVSNDWGATWDTVTDSIVVHTSVPSVTLSSPNADFVLVGSVILSGTASDVGGTVSSVEVRMRRADGKCWNGAFWTDSDKWLPAVPTTAGYATWDYLWTIDPMTVLVGNIVTVSARAQDAYGLATISAGVPSAAPIPASVSLSGGDPYTKSTGISARVQAQGANWMRYAVDSGSYPTTWTPYPVSQETTVTLPDVEGGHQVTFQFSANQTDVFATASDSILLDKTAPTVSISTPASGFALRGGLIAISGLAGDEASGVSAVRVSIKRGSWYWNGFGWDEMPHWLPTQGDPGSWSFDWSPSDANLVGYDAVVVQARGEDAAGNIGSPTQVVSFDPLEPTSLLAVPSATTISYGAKVSFDGTLTTQAGQVLPGKPVRLEYLSGGVWKQSASSVTDGLGKITGLVAAPSAKTSYRLRFLSDVDYEETSSASLVITPKVYLSTPSAPSTAYRNRAFASAGYLKPRHTAGTYPVRIYKYRYMNGSWRSYGYVKAKASNYSSYSKFAASVSLPYAGKWRLRAYAPADSAHAATYGSYRYVTVK